MRQSKYKLKVVCGYRKDQEFSIDANEAHKAYYLFANPEKKMIFANGLAMRGADIQRIEPDYNTTMGWNPSHSLTGDDWNELASDGVTAKFAAILAGAKEVARSGEVSDLQKPLIELREKYPVLTDRQGSAFAQKVLAK
jgi:hypothetical protein